MSILICVPLAAQPNSAPPGPRPEIISNIQDFEKDRGFQPTKNFRTEAPRQSAYFLCYSSDILRIPDSYEGLRLEAATEAGCKADVHKYDLFFYAVEALAGKAKITASLSNATEEREIVVVAHEDFHAVMHAFPAPIAEAATTLVGFVTAAEFAKAQFGETSEQYRNLSQEPELFLRKANLIRSYHQRLRKLYASVHDREITTTSALAEKKLIFDELNTRCREIVPEPQSFNRCPSALNNAGLAFDMTYASYYPAMYQIYLAHDRDLKLTIEALKRLDTGKLVRTN